LIRKVEGPARFNRDWPLPKVLYFVKEFLIIPSLEDHSRDAGYKEGTIFQRIGSGAGLAKTIAG